MILYTTNITSVKTYNTDTMQNIIKEVNWVLEGTEGDISFNNAGTSKLLSPADFIPFSEVTEQQLIEWVEQSPEYLSAKEHVTTYINELVQRAQLNTPPLPWEIPAN